MAERDNGPVRDHGGGGGRRPLSGVGFRCRGGFFGGSPLMVLQTSLNNLQDRCKASKIRQDADGSRALTQTAQRSPPSPSPSPRKSRERPRRVRAEHIRGGYSSPPTRRSGARRRAVALHPSAVPGARNGQELDLPASSQRG